MILGIMHTLLVLAEWLLDMKSSIYLSALACQGVGSSEILGFDWLGQPTI